MEAIFDDIANALRAPRQDVWRPVRRLRHRYGRRTQLPTYAAPWLRQGSSWNRWPNAKTPRRQVEAASMEIRSSDARAALAGPSTGYPQKQCDTDSIRDEHSRQRDPDARIGEHVHFLAKLFQTNGKRPAVFPNRKRPAHTCGRRALGSIARSQASALTCSGT